MRILANENIPGDVVTLLRESGHDIIWIRTDSPDSSDIEILSRAQTEDRILITFDKDFGELAFQTGLPAKSGVILLRITPSSPLEAARLTLFALESRNDWTGHFSVIENNLIRMTPIPG